MKPYIADRFKAVEECVAGACARANRNAASVRIVAVTKTVSAESVAEAYRAGARLLGENYVQEAMPKILEAALPEDAEWHFVGSLQSNKAKQAAGAFGLIHSLDRMSLAKELEKARKASGKPVRALIEVNVAGEGTKSGVAPEGLRELAERISSETEIEVEGLMVFPPLSDDPEASRPYFARARDLAERVRSWNLPRISMKELSMGISSDFETAIEEGATLVRIGTAIFGPRN